jgi:hypothetical protein
VFEYSHSSAVGPIFGERKMMVQITIKCARFELKSSLETGGAYDLLSEGLDREY